MAERTAQSIASQRRRGEILSLLDLNRSGPTLVLLAILLLGFGLRLYRLGEQNIWWDEGHAVWAARQSLGQATGITARDVHPPLYLWMLHAWLCLGGESEFGIRYLSLIGGSLTVALTYVVARRLIGRRAALLATLLIAAARFHIWWSQEARMYVWAAFFALLSVYLFICLRHSGNVTWWAYVFASVAALYTLYLAILVLLMENLFIAITIWHKPQRRRFLFNWALAQMSVLLLYVPWLYVALSRTRSDVAGTTFPFHLVWQLYGTVLSTGISTDLDRYTWLAIAFGLLALVGVALLLLDRRQPQRYGFAGWEVGLLLLLPLLLPPAIVYGLSLPRGIYYSPKPEARYLLLFAPLFYTLLAGAMACTWQKGRVGRGVTVLATALVLGTFVSVLPGYYAGRYLRDEYQTAVLTLGAYATASDAVLLVSGDRYPLFMYYYDRRFGDGDGPQVYWLPRHSAEFTPGNVGPELAPLAEQHRRLWLASFERSLQDPQDLVRAWLDDHRTPVLHVQQGYNYLQLYDVEESKPTVDVVSLQMQHRVDQSLGEGILLGYDLPAQESRPGDVFKPGLYVQSQDGLDLVVEWVRQDGAVVERQVLPGPTGGSVVRLVPAFRVYEYTAPGRYSIRVRAEGEQAAEIRLPAGRITQSHRLPGGNADHREVVEIAEERITFLGYGLSPSGEVRAGETLAVTLYFEAQQRLAQDYTVFVHLLGTYNATTGGPVWAQDDSYPLAGGHPTSRWLPGEVVPDKHWLYVPPNAPSGTYQIEIGLYNASTGERLPVAGSAEGRILLGDVQIVGGQ
jgi:4-amino-4-deoxy-L-arabinose transferase-like glycosyltransferase